MLAHLAHSELRVRWSLLLKVGLLAGAFGLGRAALAADLLPPSALDAGASGHVSDGLVAPAGDVSASLRLDDAQAVASGSTLGTPVGGALVSRADQASLLVGAGLARRLELSLGLHGTSEGGSQLARDTLTTPGGKHADQSGFAGASVLVKAQLLNAQGFQLALAPFAESGAGDAAEAALTRSAKARGGFLGVLSYGSPGVAEVSLNGGVRYREPEAIGAVTLRHEQFYQAGVKASATRTLSLFAGYAGRRLMVAEQADPAAGYRFRTAAQVEVGAGLKVGDADFEAYAAKGLQGGDFGYGDRSFGLSLGWMVGNFKGERRPRHSLAAEVETETETAHPAELVGPPADAAPPKAEAQKAELSKHPTGEQENAPVESIGANVDPFEALGGKSPADFVEAEANAARYRKDTETESEDDRIERELKQIKAAEAKEEAERAKIEAAEATKRQAAAREQAKQTDKLEKEWMDEAKKSADKLPGITDDELDFRGLE